MPMVTPNAHMPPYLANAGSEFDFLDPIVGGYELPPQFLPPTGPQARPMLPPTNTGMMMQAGTWQMSESSPTHAQEPRSAMTSPDTPSGKAPKKRVKSGCLTCRKRRIKCGEEKPVCVNCAKTRRHCEPAVVPPPSARQQKAALARERSKARRRQSTGAASFEESDLDMQALRRESNMLSSSADQAHVPGSFFPIGNFHSPLDQSGAFSSANLTPDLVDSQVSPQLLQPPTQAVHGRQYSPNELIGPGSGDDLLFNEWAPPLTTPTSIHESQDTYFPRQQSFRSVGSSSFDSSSYHYTADPPTATAATAAQPSSLVKHDDLLQYFMTKIALPFVVLDETREAYGTVSSTKMYIRPSNFWSFVIPGMAVKSPALLQSIYAIASLQRANAAGDQVPSTLEHYFGAIKSLGEALQQPDAMDRDDILASMLLLAYHDTSSGEVHRWGKHLRGARDFVRHRIMQRPKPGSSYIARPTPTDNLIWCYISQDVAQSFIGGNRLMLGADMIEAMPCRGEPGGIMHANDVVRKVIARLNDFVAIDRQRKEAIASRAERSPAPQHVLANDARALAQAQHDWRDISARIQSTQARLNEQFKGFDLINGEPSSQTPFGPALAFAHPGISSAMALLLTAALVCHRSRPELSPIPAEAIKATAPMTFGLSVTIIRIFAGIVSSTAKSMRHAAPTPVSVPGGSAGAGGSADNASFTTAVINCVIPGLVSGVVLRDNSQRDFLSRIFEDAYALTNWKTCLRCLQACDVAWERPSVRRFPNLPMSVSTYDSAIEREQSSVGRASSIAGGSLARGAASPYSRPSSAQASQSPVSKSHALSSADTSSIMPTKYIELDSAQRLNECVGILGNLQLKQEVAAMLGDRRVGMTDDCETLLM
ncbi:hypothetical protein PYCC9005_001977 [Savitreella phatthalungensis]